MNKPLLLFQAPCASVSGYGCHSRDIVRCLINSDKFDVRIFNTRWGNTPNNALNKNNVNDNNILSRFLKTPVLERKPDIFIQLTVPNEFQPIGTFNIGITAGIEATVAHQSLLEGLNRMDLIITTSKHSKMVFQESRYQSVNRMTKKVEMELKCKTPIEVLFEGVDTNIYKRTKDINKSIIDELQKIPENFVYLFVGHWLQGILGEDRKNIGMLIKTFLHTFRKSPSPPALLLKTSRATFSILDREEILKRIDTIKKEFKEKTLPNIYVLHGDLTNEEMNSLYNHPKIKVHVSFTKGEGFCRPLLEASLSGKPIIASAWSGQMDFLKSEFNALLKGTLTEIHDSAVYEPFLIKQAKWFTVDYNYASNVLRDVKRNYPIYSQNALKQKNYSKENFNLDKMGIKFMEILDKYLPKFSQEVQLKLPKLQKLELPKLKKIAGEKNEHI